MMRDIVTPDVHVGTNRLEKLEVSEISDLVETNRDNPEELALLLPPFLTRYEVGSLALRVEQMVETVTPSYDGYSNGLKYASEFALNLAVSALTVDEEADYITAYSVKDYLRKNRQYLKRFKVGVVIRQVRFVDNMLSDY